MNYVLENLRRITITNNPRIRVAAVLVTVAIIILFRLLSVPTFFNAKNSGVTTFLQFVWDQVSSPSPPAPAGNLTMRLIRMWSLHFVEVTLPELRGAVLFVRNPSQPESKWQRGF